MIEFQFRVYATHCRGIILYRGVWTLSSGTSGRSVNLPPMVRRRIARGLEAAMHPERRKRRVRPRVASLEALEQRRLLSASIARDPATSGEWIVTFVEDQPGLSD